MATPVTSAKRLQVQDLIRAKVDPEAAVLEVKDEDGYGVVLYLSPINVFRYVVHRWAAVDTAGGEIPGGMLYDGGYHLDLGEALDDFTHRRPR